MSNSTIIEGPDGRLYEIPLSKLAEFAVPGERVADLRRQMADKTASNTAGKTASPSLDGTNGDSHAAMPPGHTAMPPGHTAMPPGMGTSSPATGMPGPSMSFSPTGGVVLNFYFQAPPDGAAATHMPSGAAHHDASNLSGVEGYHMSFDESGIPTNHTDMLWGDYIDKQGNPAVGWHSHDPVSGNAQ